MSAKTSFEKQKNSVLINRIFDDSHYYLIQIEHIYFYHHQLLFPYVVQYDLLKTESRRCIVLLLLINF